MFAALLLSLSLAGGQLHAQAPELQGPIPEEELARPAPPEAAFDVGAEVLDKRYVELPGVKIDLPPAGSWMVGPIDMTPTKYVVWLWITGAFTLLLLVPAGLSAKRSHSGRTPPKGGHNMVEAMLLFFRDEVVMKNIGHGGQAYVPFVATLFFFILISNLLGLLPYGVSPTVSISVTGALAIMALITIEAAGMKAQGFKGWLGTIFYWNRDLPIVMRLIMLVILTPVELLGKIAKPFALAIRLMANMTAGKIVILAVIGLVFAFGSLAVAVGPVAMAVALTFLKIFVAFLQAFVFALLTSVFIGLIRHAH
jgi:F-type H+-transporting ATPase subunit a